MGSKIHTLQGMISWWAGKCRKPVLLHYHLRAELTYSPSWMWGSRSGKYCKPHSLHNDPWAELTYFLIWMWGPRSSINTLYFRNSSTGIRQYCLPRKAQKARTIYTFANIRRKVISPNNPLPLEVKDCSADPCHQHATCADVSGSHTCTCNDGYTGDGYTCTGNKRPLL